MSSFTDFAGNTSSVTNDANGNPNADGPRLEQVDAIENQYEPTDSLDYSIVVNGSYEPLLGFEYHDNPIGTIETEYDKW